MRNGAGLFPPFLKLIYISLLIAACGGVVPASERDPEVKSTTPGNLDQSVALNKSLSVTFSEEMSPETLTEKAFLLKESNGAPVKGKISLTGATATLKTAINNGLLKGDTTYVARITTRVKDLSGNSIDQDYIWRFKTASAGSPGSIDETPPRVVPSAIYPPSDARDVMLRPVIFVTFDEEIDPASVVMGRTFLMNHGVKGRLSFPEDGRTVAFSPTKDLEPKRNYKVTVRGGQTGVKDLAGIALASNFKWSFTTDSEDDLDSDDQ